ncbi:MAG: His-Xaa-Ser system protein HxsD [Candidatus Aenigmatarchaeota archaeon]
MVKFKNFEVDKKENSIFVSINPKIYPLEVIYSAAYMFIDRAYLVIDGDPETEIIVQLKAKGDEDLEKMGFEFQNELVNYAVYVVQAARTSDIRKAIVQKALGIGEKEEKICECESETPEPIDDPLEISKPWTPESAKGLKLPEGLDAENK